MSMRMTRIPVALQRNPFPLLRRFFDRCEDALVLQPILKRGMDGFAFGAGVHEVGDGMDEGVLVTDAVAGRPPVADVGLDAVAFSYLDVAKPAAVLGVLRI